MEVLRLKELLKEKGMTGKDLAKKVGVTPVSISNIIQGKHLPRLNLVVKMAKVLDVDISELFNPTKEKEMKDLIRELKRVMDENNENQREYNALIK